MGILGGGGLIGRYVGRFGECECEMEGEERRSVSCEYVFFLCLMVEGRGKYVTRFVLSVAYAYISSRDGVFLWVGIFF